MNWSVTSLDIRTTNLITKFINKQIIEHLNSTIARKQL